MDNNKVYEAIQDIIKFIDKKNQPIENEENKNENKS